jgi:hypothetical protein
MAGPSRRARRLGLAAQQPLDRPARDPLTPLGSPAWFVQLHWWQRYRPSTLAASWQWLADEWRRLGDRENAERVQVLADFWRLPWWRIVLDLPRASAVLRDVKRTLWEE